MKHGILTDTGKACIRVALVGFCLVVLAAVVLLAPWRDYQRAIHVQDVPKKKLNCKPVNAWYAGDVCFLVLAIR